MGVQFYPYASIKAVAAASTLAIVGLSASQSVAQEEDFPV